MALRDPTSLTPIVRDSRRPILLRVGAAVTFVFVLVVLLIGCLIFLKIMLLALGIERVE